MKRANRELGGAIRDLASSVDDVRKFRFINLVFDQINPAIRLSPPNITHSAAGFTLVAIKCDITSDVWFRRSISV